MTCKKIEKTQLYCFNDRYVAKHLALVLPMWAVLGHQQDCDYFI